VDRGSELLEELRSLRADHEDLGTSIHSTKRKARKK